MNESPARSNSSQNSGHPQGKSRMREKIASLFFVTMIVVSLAGCNLSSETAAVPITNPSMLPSPTQPAGPLPEGWVEKVSDIVWVDYTPSPSNLNTGHETTPDEILADLAVLRNAGFTGLVTYASTGILGRELPALAQDAGFKGLIMGIWDPDSQEEYEAALQAAQNTIVLGYCIGNEGLNWPSRYDLSKLSASIQKLRQATGKPVTTTEEIDDYYRKELLQLGDWIFPNAHPYFHHQFEPEAALRWTKGVYEDLKNRTDRFVLLKEVGLPTAGENNARLSEAAQKQYFVELAKTDLNFVYFEAFDQPGRTSLLIESHWGIFHADRTPKLLGSQLIDNGQQTVGPLETAFYVYKDAGWPENHFAPSEPLGDTGDIHVNQADTEHPHSGSSAIQVVYEAAGAAPNTCDGSPPCKWGSVYWLEPPNNWGLEPALKGKGFDLSEYSRLKLWARADGSCMIKFMVGGIDQPYGDSLKIPREKVVSLAPHWQEVEIDLAGADLSSIIGGFAWVADWSMVFNKTCTFYLDDIRFEK
jgi:exo-beta-1,3-glucanase (GH17 family)